MNTLVLTFDSNQQEKVLWFNMEKLSTSPEWHAPNFSLGLSEYLGIGINSGSLQEYGSPMLGDMFQHTTGGGI